MLLAGAIFVLTIVLVIWQPKGLGIGWSATLGAVLALISGVVHFGDIPVVWNIVWNATATFIAVIIISLLLDESGFFEWAALHVSRWGNGRGRLLFTYRFARRSGGGTVCQRWCGIDSDANCYRHAACIRFQQRHYAGICHGRRVYCRYASLPLIVSNLVNIVSADFFGLGFTEYVGMVPVDIAAIIATLVMLHLFFRKDIPPTYDLALLKAPAKAIKDLATFRTGWIVLILLLVGFSSLSRRWVSRQRDCGCRGSSFCLRWRSEVMPLHGKVLRGAPWQIVIFSLGMYLVVYGLRNAGLTEYLSGVLNVLADKGLWAATLVLAS
jgi:arsenical pump membrane protein